jgi:S1-C subfamily serine protease
VSSAARGAPLLVACVVVAGWSAGVGRAPRPERSIVAVTVNGCHAVSDHATGWVGPGGVVVTVAHVVRGSTAVVIDGAVARPVAVDLRTDVAVLVPVAPTARPPLAVGHQARAGRVWFARLVAERVVVTAVASSGDVPITIDEPGTATVYARTGLVLETGADPGQSGSPVVDRSGRVVGMVFAAARDASRSYAVSGVEIEALLAAVSRSSPSVPTGRCA